MANVDYMKMVQFLADSLNAGRNISVGNNENRMNELLIKMITPEGKELTCIVEMKKYELVMSFSLSYFTGDDMVKWIKNLEYHLEQEYRMNIKVEHASLADSHRVTVKY